MSLTTTPLQFGYFFAWLFACVLILLGIKTENLPNKILGFVLFLLSQEIQDYTFGFSNINFLWNELNGFPRNFGLLMGPACFFYLKSQTNRKFKFQKRDIVHLIPWSIYFIFYLIIFIRGKYAVQAFQQTPMAIILEWIINLLMVVSFIYYFVLAYQIYKKYRDWLQNQVSNEHPVNLEWYKNFILVVLIGQIAKWLFLIISVTQNLSYNQDWWWNLLLVGVICYIGINGVMQKTNEGIIFNETPEFKNPKFEIEITEIEILKTKIIRLFEEEKFFLNPDLNLLLLSSHLKNNHVIVSHVINNGFGKNFNDLVNEYRVKYFVNEVNNPKNNHLTMFGIALDCGFNSKATFNRSFKKVFGVSPSDYLRQSKT